MSTKLLDRSLGMPLEANPSLTIAKEQRFTIHEISPEWGFTNDLTKVYFLMILQYHFATNGPLPILIVLH